MGDVELVRIGPEDWREFREVRLASLVNAPGAFGSRHEDWVGAPSERWRARLSEVPLTVVARTADGPIGVVSGMESARVAELISMWIAPPHRGNGLAALMINQVVRWARGREKRLCLMVCEDNIVAIRAYTRAGFVDDSISVDRPGDALPHRRMWHLATTEQPVPRVDSHLEATQV